MKLYHTFESSNGFDLNKIDWERGLFCIEPWWKGKIGYEKYSEFEPNEFGDKVVEVTVKDSAKKYTIGNQFAVIKKFFPKSKNAKKLLRAFELCTFEKVDWQKLDRFIGQFFRKKGYQLIHYTNPEPPCSEEFVIIDPSIIEGIRFSS